MSKVIEIIDSDDDNNNTPTSSSNTSLINNSETDDNLQAHSRRRRRKSILHAMPDPDMQFQTISLEDDDEDFFLNGSIQANAPSVQPIKNGLSGYVPASRTLLKIQKIAPKIQAPKPPTNDEIVNTHFQKFLSDPETISDMYAIAEERSRINYLLSLNGMPEINFNLYARTELLQLQFEQRLTQRKMLNKWDGIRFLENRRGAGQNSED